jgi:two-component system chemotaxis response regulator CheB
VIAVVLSGMLDDGAAGLVTVKARGGVAIAQDPVDALHPGMPQNAIERDHPDYIVPVSELADLLCRLVQERIEPTSGNGRTPSHVRKESHPMPPSYELRAEGAAPVPVTCPECGGPLFERREGSLSTFQCLVGHRFSPASLDQEQARQLEATLWNAVRGLYERAELLRRLAGERGADGVAKIYLDRATAFEQQAEAVATAIGHLGSQAEQPEETRQ